MQQAVCVRRKKNEQENRKKSAPPKAHHEIHSRPATATNSRQRAAKHVPRVSPYSPASIDPGFVEIGHVQLSQSVLVEVHEARCGLVLAAGRVRSKKKKIEKTNNEKIPPHRKHATKSTAAQRPRPTRDGAPRNTSHA